MPINNLRPFGVYDDFEDDPLKLRSAVPEENEDDQFQFTKGLVSGTKETQALGGAAKAALGSLFGNESWKQEGWDYYRQKMSEASAYAGDVMQLEDIDWGSLDSVTDYLSYTLGSAVPSIATAVVGGGVTGFAGKQIAKGLIKEGAEGLAEKAADKLAKEAVKDAASDKAEDAAKKQLMSDIIKSDIESEIAKRAASRYRDSVINTTARRLGLAGSGAVSAGLGTGENFARILEEEGVEAPVTAIVAGIASGALDTFATPFRVFKGFFPDKLDGLKDAVTDELAKNSVRYGKVFSRMAKEGAKGAGAEGITEGLQEVVGSIAATYVNNNFTDQEKESYLQFITTEEGRSRLLNSAVAGAIGGGGISTVTGAAQGFSEERERARMQDLYQARQQAQQVLDEEMAREETAPQQETTATEDTAAPAEGTDAAPVQPEEQLRTLVPQEDTSPGATAFDGNITFAFGQEPISERVKRFNEKKGQSVQQEEGDDTFVHGGVPSTSELASSLTGSSRGAPKVKVTQDGVETTATLQSVQQSVNPQRLEDVNEHMSAVLDVMDRGMPMEVFKEVAGTYTFDNLSEMEDAPMAYFPRVGAIGIQLSQLTEIENNPEAAAAYRFSLAHEMWHAGDQKYGYSSNQGLNISLVETRDGEVDVNMGDIMTELYDAWDSGSDFGKKLKYPFSQLFEQIEQNPENAQEIIDTTRLEVFAQLGALLLANPRQLKENAPNAYAFIKGVRDNPTQIMEQESADQNIETQADVPDAGGVLPPVRAPPIEGGAQVQDGPGAGPDGAGSDQPGTADTVVAEPTERGDGDAAGQLLQTRPEGFDERSARVVELVSAAPEGLTTSEIQNDLRAGFNDTREVLDQLVENGDIVEELTGEGPRYYPSDEIDSFQPVVESKQYLYQNSRGKVRGSFAITKAISPINAETVIPGIQELVERHPNALNSAADWLRFERDLTGSNETLRPPHGLIRLFNDMDGWAETHSRLSNEQLEAARKGLQIAKEVGQEYESGKADVDITAKLLLWGIMSRMLTASAQEAGFVDLLTKSPNANKGYADDIIDATIDGTLTQDDVDQWVQTKTNQGAVSKLIPEGSFGRSGVSNANDWAKLMLKMSERTPEGRSKLEDLHDLIADRSIPTQEVRRRFQGMVNNPGIGNKVFSFLMLITGRDDVVILDRIQLNTMWDTGRYGKLIYDDIAENFEGAHGLARYEVIENALNTKIKELYARLGREEEGSVGRYHWESWVLNSGQVVAHPTMAGLLADARGEANPYANMGAPEGKQNMYRYGAIYARDENAESYFMYADSRGQPYRFDIKQFQEFVKQIPKKANGIIPPNFKVSEYTNGYPWYEADGVNREALDTLIRSYAKAEATESEYLVTEDPATGQADSPRAIRAAYKDANRYREVARHMQRDLERADIQYNDNPFEIPDEDIQRMSPEGRRFWRALAREDFLQFDDTDALMIAIFEDGDVEGFDVSPAFKTALGRFVNEAGRDGMDDRFYRVRSKPPEKPINLAERRAQKQNEAESIKEMQDLMSFRERITSEMRETSETSKEVVANNPDIFAEFTEGTRFTTKLPSGKTQLHTVLGRSALKVSDRKINKKYLDENVDPTVGREGDVRTKREPLVQYKDGYYQPRIMVRSVPFQPDPNEESYEIESSMYAIGLKDRVEFLRGPQSTDTPQPIRTDSRPDLTKIRDDVAPEYEKLKAAGFTPEAKKAYSKAVASTVRPYESVPLPATEEEMRLALKSNQQDGINQDIPDDADVGLRLDISAYMREENSAWVPTIYDEAGKGADKRGAVYRATASVKNANLTLSDALQQKAQKVIEGGAKSPFARIQGSWINRTDDENMRLAQEALHDPEWIQVGFDPRRRAVFYDRTTGETVLRADEIIQIGPLVLAKNAEVTADPDSFRYVRTQHPNDNNARFNLQDEVAVEVSTLDTLAKYFPSLISGVRKTGMNARRRLSDRLERLKQLEQGIAESFGLDRLPSEISAYDQENLMHSKAQKQLEDFEKEYIESLAEMIKNADLDIDQVGLYLLAKHAPERNAVLAQKERDLRQKLLDYYQAQFEESVIMNDIGSAKIIEKIERLERSPLRFQEKASGMTNEEALLIEEQARIDGKYEQLEEIAQAVYKMLGDMRQNMVNKGLLDESTREDWENTYEFYVPLKGFAAYPEGLEMKGGDAASTFNIRGSESFRAKGRITLPVNPLIVSIKDAQEKIVRAEKNVVAQRLLAMLSKIKSPNQWEVFSPENLPLNPENPAEKMSVQAMMRERRYENGLFKYIQVKRGGDTYFIEVKDQELNRQLQTSGVGMFNNQVDFMNKVLTGLRTFQNFRRNMLINYNPTWGLINPIRDLQTGLAFALAEQDVKGGRINNKELVGKIVVGYMPSLKAYWRNRRGKEGSTDEAREYDQYAREYVEDGAPTGLSVAKSLDEIQARFESIMGDGWYNKTKNKLRPAADLVEDGNQTMENAARLSTYVEARKAGVSRADAATLAKDLTVNFNRKGEYSSAIDSLYLFFNAAVQGNVNIMNALLRKGKGDTVTKAQMLATSIVALGAATTAMSILDLGEDEDDEWKYSDYNEYALRTNIVLPIPIPGVEQQFGIPLPYGYGFLHNIGRYAAEYVFGVKDENEVAVNLMSAFDHHFNPIGLHASKSQADLFEAATQKGIGLLPDILEFGGEIATNTNFFGSEIAVPPNRLMVDKARSEPSKRGTNELISGGTRFINEVFGGGTYVDAAGINPEYVQHTIEFFMGGVGRFFSDASDTAAKMVTEEPDLKSSDLPILGKFLPIPSEYSDRFDYYERKEEIESLYQEYNTAPSSQKAAVAERYGRDRINLYTSLRAVDKELRKLSKQRRAIEQNELMDPVVRYEKIQALLDQEEQYFDRFNKLYNKVNGD